jgi:hypothetical protein
VFSSNWSALLLAFVGPGITVFRDPVSMADRGQTRIVFELFMDSIVLEPGAFCKCDDAATA